MTTRCTVVIDDEDRDGDVDSKPWSATLMIESLTDDQAGQVRATCGIGATVAEALRDLADEIGEELR